MEILLYVTILTNIFREVGKEGTLLECFRHPIAHWVGNWEQDRGDAVIWLVRCAVRKEEVVRCASDSSVSSSNYASPSAVQEGRK